MRPLLAEDWTLLPARPPFTEKPVPVRSEGTLDLTSKSPDWVAGWEARGAHIPPLSTWRGVCGHLWDRAVEDTDVCPRCRNLPYAYGGPHDDCIASIPHLHDHPYQTGDWA